MKRLTLLITLCFLAGCGLTPESPLLKVAPDHVLQVAQQTALNESFFAEGEWPEREWWQLFGDAQLNELIHQAIANYPSMRVAEAKILRAQATKNQKFAPLFPSLNFECDTLRTKLSKNSIFGFLNAADPLFPLQFTQNEVNLVGKYQLDLWQKTTNEMLSAMHQVRAIAMEGYVAKLALAISVADSYFHLQISTARKKLAEAFAVNRQQMLQLVELRSKNALDNRLNINAAAAALKEAQLFLSTLAQEATQANHTLQALLAEDFETCVTPIQVSDSIGEPFPLPGSLPMDLLAHRPDVWVERWHVEAAASQISVAKANFYPNIDLLGVIGFQALSQNPLLIRDSLWGFLFGPSLNLPIFQGGALEAELDYRQQEFNIAVATYDEKVLNAVKEVLSAIAGVEESSNRYMLAKGNEELAKSDLNIATERSQRLISRSEVLSFENKWLQAQDNTYQYLLVALRARLELIRALGGGF